MQPIDDHERPNRAATIATAAALLSLLLAAVSAQPSACTFYYYRPKPVAPPYSAQPVKPSPPFCSSSGCAASTLDSYQRLLSDYEFQLSLYTQSLETYASDIERYNRATEADQEDQIRCLERKINQRR